MSEVTAMRFFVSGVSMVTAHDHDIEVASLRKQLDEANEAYGRLADGVPAAMAKYHKCKKQLDEALELLEGYRWKDIDINNFVEKANESP